MYPLHVARNWLYSLQSSSSDLVNLLAPGPDDTFSIYSTVSPEGKPLPLIVNQFITGSIDETTQDRSVLIMSRPLFLVKAIVEGRDESLALDIANQIWLACHNASDTIEGYKVNCVLEEPYMGGVVDSGKLYRQAGGYYRILVRPEID